MAVAKEMNLTGIVKEIGISAVRTDFPLCIISETVGVKVNSWSLDKNIHSLIDVDTSDYFLWYCMYVIWMNPLYRLPEFCII